MLTLDHIVLAVADLELACHEFEELTGCKPVAGGPHPGLGTHNALVAFAQGCYLELIAPDPDQNAGGEFARALSLLTEPNLLHWAIGTTDLPAQQLAARRLAFAPGPILDTERVQPNGERLQWQLMGLGGHDLGGCAPFYIDWCECVHPSKTSPAVGELVEFAVGVPEPDRLSSLFNPLPQVTVSENALPSLTLKFTSKLGPMQYQTQKPAGFAFSAR